jgi:hypothetical protein
LNAIAEFAGYRASVENSFSTLAFYQFVINYRQPISKRNFMIHRFHRLACFAVIAAVAALLGVLPACAAPPTALVLSAKSKVSIALPAEPTLPEQTAAQELKDYLTRAVGGEYSVVTETENQNIKLAAPAIYVGNTAFAKAAGVDGSTLASEEWRIKTQDGNLILVGSGTRGTLYSTYHFLEDVVGVHWWNPWEETVPKLGVLPVQAVDARGKPSFSYRDIYQTYGHDEGRFAIRNRLDRDGDAPIAAKYGGSRDYGPPYHVHTFYKILDPAIYYKDHPDWFLVPGGGAPTHRNSQLAMSNPGMRAEFLKLLKEIIRQSQADAREKGLPAPDVFSVSQEDNRIGFAGPNDAKLVAENGGAESAILLDFINYLADGIKDEFPHVYIDTLAYFSGEKAPTKIRPRDNVIIRLTDTTSNLILPVTDPRNHEFHDNIVAWGKLTKNLRVWDYAITFNYVGLPTPSEYTYPIDLQFWKANNVDGIFVEHEYPILADRRDFKIWLQCKLFENPNLNYDALVRQFTDGFYGAAGKDVREYFLALDAEAKKVGAKSGFEEITWFVQAKPYNYLPLDFLIRANAMMDKAQSKAGKDEVLQRRVRHARMSLDRFIVLFHHKFAQQWKRGGHTPETFPLNRDAIAARYLKSWNEQIDLRLPENRRTAEREKARAEVDHLTSVRTLPPPARFKDIPATSVETYGPGSTRNYANQAKVVKDAEAEIGVATRLLMSDVPAAERAKYNLPMPWGIYDTVGKKHGISKSITAADIPAAGYHWYKLGETKLTGNDYIFFFWSWVIQLDVADMFDGAHPNQQYEIWAEIKFEGPMFPHAKEGDKDAISVERVVLVRK